MLFQPSLIHPRNCHQIHLDEKFGIPFLLMERLNRRTNELAVETGFLKRFPKSSPMYRIAHFNDAFGKCSVATTRRRNEAELHVAPLPTTRDNARLLAPRFHETTIIRTDAPFTA